jgi:hypothetical protein
MNLFFKLFFLTVLVFSIHENYAQDSFKEKKSYTLTVNTNNSTIKFEVLSKKETFPAQKSLIYFWYSTNKILSTTGGYDGKLLNGAYAAFYLNNNLKEKGKFYKGLKDGQWISWFENGKIMEIVNWKRGLRHGAFRSFDETGRPVLEAEYSHGKLNGRMATYTNGVVTDSRVYADDKEVVPVAKKTKKARTEKAADKKERNQKQSGSNKKSSEPVNSNTKKKPTLQEKFHKLFHRDKKDQQDKPVNSSADKKGKRNSTGSNDDSPSSTQK